MPRYNTDELAALASRLPEPLRQELAQLDEQRDALVEAALQLLTERQRAALVENNVIQLATAAKDGPFKLTSLGRALVVYLAGTEGYTVHIPSRQQLADWLASKTGQKPQST